MERRTRTTVDPLERLRFVRRLMDAPDPPEETRRRPVQRIVLAIAAAIGAAILLWRIG
jgi:hypothetical protein